jgi:hypothetical protein
VSSVKACVPSLEEITVELVAVTSGELNAEVTSETRLVEDLGLRASTWSSS